MKKLLLVGLALLMAGCSTPQRMRTGSICIKPFETSDFSTSDPVEIKQDVVKQIESELRKELHKQIAEETKLLNRQDCSVVDYTLTGKMERVDSGVQHHRNFLTGLRASNRQYTVAVSGMLKDNKTQAVLVEFTEDGDKPELQETLAKLSENIVKQIR